MGESAAAPGRKGTVAQPRIFYDGVLDRCVGVDAVLVVEVDHVHAQPPQAWKARCTAPRASLGLAEVPMAHPNPNGTLRLSVLDQSPIPEGSTGGEALHNSIDLARLADDMGYHRYWLAKHHGTPALACTSPEVMIGLVGAATARIRVGSGGVMLPHYRPLKV